MQLSTLFLAVIFTSAVIADGSAEWGKGKGEEHHCHHKIGKLQRECDEIFFLERLEGLVANSTALAEATHNNATKIGELQAKASQDAPKLAALKANHTLIVECEILAAEEKLEHDCFELLKLEHFLKFAANFTEVSNQAKNNATRISEIAAEASTSATKLQQLQSNATLVSLCFIVDAHEREKHQCEEIKEAESSKIAARLAELQSNAALVSDCASFEHHPATVASAQADTDGTANTTGSATTTQTSTTTSEAGGRLLAKIGVPSSIAVMAGGVMLL